MLRGDPPRTPLNLFTSGNKRLALNVEKTTKQIFIAPGAWRLMTHPIDLADLMLFLNQM